MSSSWFGKKDKDTKRETMALQGIPLSIVYAVWSGVGTIFVAILSRFMFEESFSVTKIISLLLIVAGVIGIHLSNGI